MTPLFFEVTSVKETAKALDNVSTLEVLGTRRRLRGERRSRRSSEFGRCPGGLMHARNLNNRSVVRQPECRTKAMDERFDRSSKIR